MAMDEERFKHLLTEHEPGCADCGEPVELASPDDPESWIHAANANYFGDHTAWLDEGIS